MSLKDRIQSDIHKIFFRESEFARSDIDWNGRKIIGIIDNEAALAHKNQNTLSVDWDVGEIDTILRAPTDQFAVDGKMPVASETVMLDGKMHRIESVTDNEGELIILLRKQEARGVF